MKNCKVVCRLMTLAITGLVTLGSASSAMAARSSEFAYFADPSSNNRRALLVDWLGTTRARVTNAIGTRLGSVVHEGALHVVTLDSPVSQPFYGADPDSCGEYPSIRQETTQIALRYVSGDVHRGTSQVIEIGTRTVLDGCDAGRSVPFGALTDTGETMNRLAMDARPPMHDLLPGTRVAGLSEAEFPPESDDILAVDVVTLYAGGMASFSRTGHVVPAAFNAERWLVLSLGAFERAYTRLAVDRATGAETWMRAEWSGNQALRVVPELVVKPAAPAGFGTEHQASRVWESGLFSRSQAPFFINLYEGGTGERVAKELSDGTETRQSITWGLAGSTVVQTRFTGPFRRERTWVPLRNHGAKVRFVMESETQTLEDGTVRPFLLPRVNFYIDRGEAVPPATP